MQLKKGQGAALLRSLYILSLSFALVVSEKLGRIRDPDSFPEKAANVARQTQRNGNVGMEERQFFGWKRKEKKGLQPRRDREAKKHVLLGNQTFPWAHLPKTRITYTCETETSLGGKNMKGPSFIPPLARPSLGPSALGLPEQVPCSISQG